MKRFLFLVGIILLVTVVTSCGKNEKESFYENKNSLSSPISANDEDIQFFKASCREAAEAYGFEIEDDLIRIWTHFSGLDMAGMQYEVLTKEGDYISFAVSISEGEVLQILDGSYEIDPDWELSVTSFDEDKKSGTIGIG